MPYKIIRADTGSLSLFTSFQIETAKQAKSSSLQDLNNRPLVPISKKALEHGAEIGMLYVAVEAENLGNILGLMIGHSPVAAIGDKKMQLTFGMLQELLHARYILVVQSLFKPDANQEEMFIEMLQHIMDRAHFFDFERVVFIIQGNQHLENFLCSCTDFDLVSVASKQKQTILKSPILKK